MPAYKAAKDKLTLLFAGNASSDIKLKPLLVYHSENPRALKNIAKGSLPVVWKSNPKAWLHRPFSRTGFSTTLSQMWRNIAWRRMSHSTFFCCSTMPWAIPHSWTTFIPMSCSASATEYYVAHPTYGPGVIATFKKYYYYYYYYFFFLIFL